MFIVIGNERRQLDFSQAMRCGYCGRDSRCGIYMENTALRLFSVPVARWNRRCFAVMSCCGARAALPKEMGVRIERGLTVHLVPGMMNFPKCGLAERAGCDCPQDKVPGGGSGAETGK